MKIKLSKARKKAAPVSTKIDTKGALPFQVPKIIEHVKAFRAGQTSRMEGSDMGAGKTYITCIVARNLDSPLLVIGPKNSKKTWENAAEETGAPLYAAMNYEAFTTGTKQELGCFPVRKKAFAEYAQRCVEYEEANLQFAARNPKFGPEMIAAFQAVADESNPAAVRELMKRYPDAPIKPNRPIVEDNTFEWDIDALPDNVLVVLDEVHRAGGQTSLNSELLMALKRQNIRHLNVSATAACDSSNMKALGYSLDMHDGDDFQQWALQNGCIQSQWGGLQFVGSEQMLMEIHEQIYPERGCRIRVEDLGNLFPETQISADAYDMGSNLKKLQKAEEEMKNELARWQDGMSTDKGMNPLVIMLRMRQKFELLKVPTFIEMARDAVIDGSRVLIFVNFQETLFALAEKIKTNCLYYGGNKGERDTWLQKFQDNDKKAQVMILNIAAGAESISCHDLHGKHPRYSLISPTWSATKMKQCLGRPHRAGGKSPSIQRIVYAAGTIEEKVCSNVRTKLNNMTVLNDFDMMPDYMLDFLRPYNGLLSQAVALDDQEK